MENLSKTKIGFALLAILVCGAIIVISGNTTTPTTRAKFNLSESELTSLQRLASEGSDDAAEKVMLYYKYSQEDDIKADQWGKIFLEIRKKKGK